MHAVLAALLVIGVMLAGCSDADDGPDAGGDAPDLSTGKGAITGLVIDDRYRPIADAKILVQEAGETATSNANGEFSVTDLAPGTYTLRVTAEGHEAAPYKTQVTEGEFSEARIVARRVVSTEGQILTREYAIFIACDAYATTDCTFDLSGDTDRSGISDNFSELAADVTYSVWEISMNNPGIYCFEVREQDLTNSGQGLTFSDWCGGQGTTYIKGILQKGEVYDMPGTGSDPWDPAVDTDAILFNFGNNEATCWQTDPYRCAGVGLGIKAKVLVSFFLGEPEVDIEAYCVLC